MDINTYFGQLQENLKLRLHTIELEDSEVKSRTGKYLMALSRGISELKIFVHNYSFRNLEEEIGFFKESKPVLLSEYYYYERLFSIKINEPFDSGALRDFYHAQLRDLQNFVKANAEFYCYYLSNSTEFDDKYFTRAADRLKDPDMDNKFSTGYDNTLARILAFQRVKEYLIGLIQNLDNGCANGALLKWTGTKSALIELIYALHCVDTVNGGHAEIKQIADSFEGLFNISLGNYYRQFQEIRLRKKDKATFLDLMKEKFIQRMDELDEK